MTRDITPAGSPATGAVDEAFAEVRASFGRICLAAGIEALGTMMEAVPRTHIVSLPGHVIMQNIRDPKVSFSIIRGPAAVSQSPHRY